MTTATLDNAIIFIKPSINLQNYIKAMKSNNNMPERLLNIKSNNTIKLMHQHKQENKLLINDSDLAYIKSMDLPTESIAPQINTSNAFDDNDKLLNVNDLHWLYEQIAKDNLLKSNEKIYLHEIMQGSEIVIPQNKEIPRNPELEKRCIKLKNQQDNRRYKAMTKNIDNVRIHHPEDTIAYQMKQINRHLIAIGQFIISVLAGFLFGFMGLELMVGTLDFGFRLLMGIMCALIIALAELYFLAKKLNEDLEIEYKLDKATERNQTPKAKQN